MKRSPRAKWVCLRIISFILIQAFFCLNVSSVFSQNISPVSYQKQVSVNTLSPRLSVNVTLLQQAYLARIEVLNPQEKLEDEIVPREDQGRDQGAYLTWKNIFVGYGLSFVSLFITVITNANPPVLDSQFFYNFILLDTFLLIFSVAWHEAGHWIAAIWFNARHRRLNIDKTGIYYNLDKKMDAGKTRQVIGAGLKASGFLGSIGLAIVVAILAKWLGMFELLKYSAALAAINGAFVSSTHDWGLLMHPREITHKELLGRFLHDAKASEKSIKDRAMIMLAGGNFAVGKMRYLEHLIMSIEKTNNPVFPKSNIFVTLYRKIRHKLSYKFKRKIYVIEADRLLFSQAKRDKLKTELSYPQNTFEIDYWRKIIPAFREGEDMYLPLYLHIFSKRIMVSRKKVAELMVDQSSDIKELDKFHFKVVKNDKYNIKDKPLKDFISNEEMRRIIQEIKANRGESARDFVKIFIKEIKKPLKEFLVDKNNELYLKKNNNGTGEIVERIVPDKNALYIFEFEQALRFYGVREAADINWFFTAGTAVRGDYFKRRWKDGHRYLHLSKSQMEKKLYSFFDREAKDDKNKRGQIYADAVVITDEDIEYYLLKQRSNDIIEEEIEGTEYSDDVFSEAEVDDVIGSAGSEVVDNDNKDREESILEEEKKAISIISPKVQMVGANINISIVQFMANSI